MSKAHSPATAPAQPTFDGFSTSYEEALERGISVSGEDSSYFAEGRLRWLAKRLSQRGFAVDRAIDFGCGIGNSLPLLRDRLGAQQVAGIDVSSESIAVARQRFATERFELATCDQLTPAADYDLAFCNGVFHHIPLAARAASARQVFDHLRPGGLFAFFENNPLNPGTRYVMSRIPFDKEAITLTPWNARRLLRSVGFQVLFTDYLFYFPKLLAMFRRLEPYLCRLPLGAQYFVLCEKPGCVVK